MGVDEPGQQRAAAAVIVVDDGSKDRTAEIATEAATDMPLTLIQHGINRGLGMGIQNGLVAGMKAADAVVVMDADGEVEVRVLVSPTLDIRHRGGLRYALSVNDGEPQLVNVRLDPTPGDRDFTAWEAAVTDNVHIARSRHQVRAGANTVKLWLVDPGLVFQRIELVRRATPTTLGPEESVRR